MAVADKKLAKKLAKMSEEDRTAFLEQMRLDEEEKQKKKEEMLSKFLKDKLAKEEKSTKLNLIKLQNQWRVIMRKTRMTELQKDVQVLSQTFERTVDRKDAIISSLASDLEEAEEQYQVALHSHVENIDTLIDFESKRVQDLEDVYKKELETLRQEFDKERQTTLDSHTREMSDLGDISYAMELQFNAREVDAQNDFQSIMDEIKNKHLEDTHALSAQRKALLDDLWKEFKKETNQYKEGTEEKKLRFEALKKKDEESARTIGQQMKRLHKLQESIVQCKQKMNMSSKENEEKTRAIKAEREAVMTQFSELKAEMTQTRESERSRLTTLTLQSKAATKKLEDKKEMSEKILKLAEMCRKLETEDEKVLPFYASSLSAEEEDEVAKFEGELPSEALAQVIHEYSSLENFWKRYNKVLLEKMALEKESHSLEEENRKLKTLLKQYLDGISVNDEVLSQANPLFVVNSQKTSNQMLGVPVGDPRIQRNPQPTVVVEAAHVVKNILH